MSEWWEAKAGCRMDMVSEIQDWRGSGWEEGNNVIWTCKEVGPARMRSRFGVIIMTRMK